MDTVLRDYLKLADHYHEFVDKYAVALNIAKLEEMVKNLQVGIKTIQSVAKRMADVSNVINHMLNYKKANKPKLKEEAKKNKNALDPYPTENDHAVLRVLYPLPEENKDIIENISIPVRMVQKLADIPINHLYYIKELKQYAININGVVIKGNLANITNYQSECSARCDYGTECKGFKTGIPCKYYHDPEDYLKLNLPIPDITRNFTVGSFIYSQTRKPKTYFTRHIGSYNNLVQDLQNLKTVQYREEISNREGQLIHDLLIYNILHSKGLLIRYPHFDIVNLLRT
jgi:hypothetical protein